MGRTYEVGGMVLLVGICIAVINECRWSLKKGKEIDARMKKRAEEHAKKMASYRDRGRLVRGMGR
jgi:hypothetical protein